MLYLYAPALVVNVVISRVVGAQMLQWIPGQGVPTVIVHGFEGQACEKQNALTRAHTGSFVCNSSAQCVQ